MNQPIIQSLWIGSRLSVMEQLSIRSFLLHGHPFHLYTYEPVANIPAGAVVCPAEEILPATEIFRYQMDGYGKGSFAGFSNFFRYKLLLERGGWWTDLDSVCIRPLAMPGEHVLGYERAVDGGRQVAAGLIKAPAGSRLMDYCWQTCQRLDRTQIVWGQTGPRLVSQAIQRVDLPVRILEPAAFYPIDYWQVWQLIRERQLPVNCYSIHLWNSKWRRERLDPDSIYDPECIYEQLKRRFGVTSPAGASYGPGWMSVAKLRLREFKANLRRRPAILKAA